MKARLFIIAILSAILMGGCITVRGSGDVVSESRRVSDFSEVSLRGIGTVIIEQGESESLEIEAEDNLIDLIETRVVGDELVIDYRDDYSLRPTRGINIYVSAIEITGIELSGSGDILAGDLETEDLKVEVNGSGDIDIASVAAETVELKIYGSGDLEVDEVEADKLEALIAGSGSVEVAGTVVEQEIRVDGSGKIKAADLESETAEVVIAGSGDSTIWVQESLDIKVTGSGTINYYGNPVIDQTITGSGDVNSRGDR